MDVFFFSVLTMKRTEKNNKTVFFEFSSPPRNFFRSQRTIGDWRIKFFFVGILISGTVKTFNSHRKLIRKVNPILLGDDYMLSLHTYITLCQLSTLRKQFYYVTFSQNANLQELTHIKKQNGLTISGTGLLTEGPFLF